MSGKILFVIKTPQSQTLSKSDGLERSKIFSHVQPSTHIRAQDGKAKKSKKSGPQPNRTTKSKTASIEKQLSAIALVPALNSLTQYREDPFSQSLPMNAYVDDLVAFFSSDDVARVFPIKPCAISTRHIMLSMIFEDPVARDTLLCATASSTSAWTGQAEHAVWAMRYKASALKGLQGVLSKPEVEVVNPSSLYAISLLLWIELLQGNEDDLRAHCSGLSYLVSRALDISKSPLCISSTILTCSYLCSAMLQLPPLIKPSLHCPERSKLSSVFANVLQNSTSQAMGSRFFTSSNLAILGDRLADIVSEQRQMTALKDFCSQQSIPITFEDVQYVFAKEAVTQYGLCALPFEEELNSAQKAVCLALFLFGQPIIRVSKTSAAFSRAMTRWLKEFFEAAEFPSCDLQLWVLFIMAYICRDQGEWPWVVNRMSGLLADLDIQTKGQMEEILQGFYYYPEYFGCALRAVWAEHLRR